MTQIIKYNKLQTEKLKKKVKRLEENKEEQIKIIGENAKKVLEIIKEENRKKEKNNDGDER